MDGRKAVPRAVRDRAKLNEARFDILAALSAGETQESIRRRYGVTSPNLSNWLRTVSHRVFVPKESDV